MPQLSLRAPRWPSLRDTPGEVSGPQGHEQDAWQPQKAFGGGGRCHQQGAGQSADAAGTVMARRRSMSSGLGTQPRKSRGPGRSAGLGNARLQLKDNAAVWTLLPRMALSCPAQPSGPAHPSRSLDLGKAASSRNHAIPSPSREPRIELARMCPRGRHE